jgi:hypothetical protein
VGRALVGNGVRIIDANGESIAERNIEGIDSPYRSSVDGPNDTQGQVISSSTQVNRRFVDQ